MMGEYANYQWQKKHVKEWETLLHYTTQLGKQANSFFWQNT